MARPPRRKTGNRFGVMAAPAADRLALRQALGSCEAALACLVGGNLKDALAQALLADKFLTEVLTRHRYEIPPGLHCQMVGGEEDDEDDA